MKKLLLYSALFAGAGILLFAAIKLSQSYQQPITIEQSSEQESINNLFQENKDHIDRVFALCEIADDSMRSFGNKSYEILNDHNQWNQKYVNIFKEKPEILKKIELEWLDAVSKLTTSMSSEGDAWKKQKKSYAIQAVESFISKETMAEYLKGKQ